jgi:hypothetical protein
MYSTGIRCDQGSEIFQGHMGSLNVARDLGRQQREVGKFIVASDEAQQLCFEQLA